jgi:hypothetical protein
VSVPSSTGDLLLKMEPTQCSETSAFSTQTPGKYPEDNLSLGLHLCSAGDVFPNLTPSRSELDLTEETSVRQRSRTHVDTPTRTWDFLAGLCKRQYQLSNMWMIHASDSFWEFFPACERVSVADGRLSYLVCDAVIHRLHVCRPGTHCIVGWVGPKAGLDWCGKIVPPPLRDSIPGPSSP